MRVILITLTIIQSIFAISFDRNGYKDVIVSIHPDVPETNGQTIVDNIKVSIINSMDKVFTYFVVLICMYIFRHFYQEEVMNSFTRQKDMLS